MLEKILYKNHLGEVFELGKNGVYANYSDLRDYAWNYDSANNKITNFTKGVVSKSLPFVIYANNVEEAIMLKNQLYEIAEKDIIAEKKGQIIIGNYYMECFICGISKGNYLTSKRYMTGQLSIVTDSAYWRKSHTLSFVKRTNPYVGGFEYPYDYPFDYSSSPVLNTDFTNQFAFATDFELIIYGLVENPEITINGHKYKASVNLEDEDILIINSINKTMVKKTKVGIESNEFNNRYKLESIFEKIKSGYNTISWNGNFGFDLKLIDNRSEPKWG